MRRYENFAFLGYFQALIMIWVDLLVLLMNWKKKRRMLIYGIKFENFHSYFQALILKRCRIGGYYNSASHSYFHAWIMRGLRMGRYENFAFLGYFHALIMIWVDLLVLLMNWNKKRRMLIYGTRCENFHSYIQALTMRRWRMGRYDNLASHSFFHAWIMRRLRMRR